MKIGIITLPPYANYGGILQAYALCHVLQGMGHEPEVIYTPMVWDYRPLWRRPLSIVTRIVKKYVLCRPHVWVFYERKSEREWPMIVKNTFGFIQKYIPRREYVSYGEIQEGDYDAFVVGSDQVWRPQYFNANRNNIADAYLRFAEGWNVKRIAYAASFGLDKWEYTAEQTKECARLVQSFDVVTVREGAAVYLCRNHLGVNAKLVVDPTMLLDRADFECLMTGKPSSHVGGILNYILDWNDEKRIMLDKLESSTGLESFRVNSRYEELFAPAEERIQPSVESWLQGFRDADMVVTDSFHACAFSIIFNKPFYVIGNQSRGLARIHSLLAMFGLENRLVYPNTTFNGTDAIDWQKVNERRNELKSVGLDILSSQLKM